MLVLSRIAKKNCTEMECEGGVCGEVCGRCHLYGECSVVFGGWFGFLLDGADRSWENELKAESL